MLHKSTCNCGAWKVEIEFSRSTKVLRPRVCDCDYCKNNPSRIVSDPSMIVGFAGGLYFIRQNGDRLANFYYCEHCSQLLAVGRHLYDGILRGAVNCMLFPETTMFGEIITVQPRLLSSTEKQKRWGKLWGELNGL